MSHRGPLRPSIWSWKEKDITFRNSLNLKWPFLLGLPQVYIFIQLNIKYEVLSILQNIFKLRFYCFIIQNHIDSYSCFETAILTSQTQQIKILTNA